MNRRDFLALGAAVMPGTLLAQNAAAPMAPPPAAKITSSVMLRPLKGSFEERVTVAAKAGIQAVELVDEYAAWEDAALSKARKLVNSFHMGIDAIVALPDFAKSVTAARALNCPQIILRDAGQGVAPALAAAEKANLIVCLELPSLADSMKHVKDADNPHLRLAFRIAGDRPLESVKEALDYTSIFHVHPAAPGVSYKEIYQALQKSGYSHYVTFEFTPAGDPVQALIEAADAFRAALLEHPGVPSN